MDQLDPEFLTYLIGLPVGFALGWFFMARVTRLGYSASLTARFNFIMFNATMLIRLLALTPTALGRADPTAYLDGLALGVLHIVTFNAALALGTYYSLRQRGVA